MPRSLDQDLLRNPAWRSGAGWRSLSARKSYPQITRAELDAWRGLSYADLAYAVLSKFIDDIPPADLKVLVDKTYTAEVYCNARSGDKASDITPVHQLEPGLALLELSNGPTLAFKDMAMQLLGNLFEYVLAKRGEEINILGATSGDTGSAAEYAMRGKHGVRVFMLSPHGRMSAFQRAQMYSLQDDNIYNIAVRGMFDDAQDIVKAVSNDHAFKAKYKIGAVNSINWARVAAQIVYYFKGYFAATKSNDEQVAFCRAVGQLRQHLRRPHRAHDGPADCPLVLATNENDVLDEFFRTGVYRPRGTAETHTTSSPSMDISKASNFERFVFDLVGRDGAKVRELWAKVDAGGSFDLSARRCSPRSAGIRFRLRQQQPRRPSGHDPSGLREIRHDDRHAYRRWSQGRAGTAASGCDDAGTGNRPAGEVRGNHPRGAKSCARAPCITGRNRGAAAASGSDEPGCGSSQTVSGRPHSGLTERGQRLRKH